MRVAIVLAIVIRKTISRIVVKIVIEQKVQNYAATFPRSCEVDQNGGKGRRQD